jgi:hypothetical protein
MAEGMPQLSTRGKGETQSVVGCRPWSERGDSRVYLVRVRSGGEIPTPSRPNDLITLSPDLMVVRLIGDVTLSHGGA